MKAKYIWRGLAYSAIGFSAVIIIVVIAALWMLPSAHEIAKKIPVSKNKVENEVASAVTSPATPASPATTTQPADLSIAQTTTEPSPAQAVEKTKNDDMSALTDETKPLVSVCAYAENAANSSFAKAKNQNDFYQMIGDAFSKDSDDPFVQTISPPFRFLFRQPELKEFIAAADAAKAANDTGFKQKAEFYWLFTRAIASVRSALPQMEKIGDRSYQLMTLLKVLAHKPEMWKNPAVQNYCHEIEESLTQITPVDQAEENPELEKLISEAGLTPQDVGFNPHFKTKFNFDYNEHSFSIGSTWLENYKN